MSDPFAVAIVYRGDFAPTGTLGLGSALGDLHGVVVDWGDGSGPVQLGRISAGQAPRHKAQHDYATDGTFVLHADGKDASGKAVHQDINVVVSVHGGGVTYASATDGPVGLGGAGADSLAGGSGGDAFMLGGAGNDTLVVTGGLINNAIGGAGNDTITATGGTAGMNGNGGNDLLDASGADSAFLEGGRGKDTLIASQHGPTQFGYARDDIGHGVDIIRGFVPGRDMLVFHGDVFNGTAPDIIIDHAPSAPDATPALLYDLGTGALAIDFDGSGPDAAVAIATLKGAPALGAGDIFV